MSQRKKIKILLADDHMIVTQGISQLLSIDPSFEIVGAACDGKQLLQQLQMVVPDIILLDIDMPIMNGIEALKEIKIHYPRHKVIMLSLHLQPGIIENCLRLGADSYLKKDCDVDEMIHAIKEVNKRGYYLSRELSHLLKNTALPKLTPPEIAVLKLLCKGNSSKKIGEELNISENTVESHRKSIFKKLGVKTAIDALREAVKNGFIKL